MYFVCSAIPGHCLLHQSSVCVCVCVRLVCLAIGILLLLIGNIWPVHVV